MLLDDVISNGEDSCSRMILMYPNLIDLDIGFRLLLICMILLPYYDFSLKLNLRNSQ